MVFLAKAGAAARNDMPSIVAQKIASSRRKNSYQWTQHLAAKDLTAKDAKVAKKFEAWSRCFAFFATFAVAVLADC